MALTESEQKAFYQLQQNSFFSRINIPHALEEIQNSSLDTTQAHFILYKGQEISGMAHLEFLSPLEGILHSFAFENSSQSFPPIEKNVVFFLYLLEKWGRHHGLMRLKIPLPLENHDFYKSLGYRRILRGDLTLLKELF